MINRSALAAFCLVLVLGACATEDSVKQAQASADSAKAQAQAAQTAANQAMQAAQAANQAAQAANQTALTASQKADKAEADTQALNQKVDQAFQKSLRK